MSWKKLEFRYLWAIILGRQKKEFREYRQDQEDIRFLAYYQMLPNVKDPDNFKLTDIVKYSWDKQVIKNEPSNRDKFEEQKKRYGLK